MQTGWPLWARGLVGAVPVLGALWLASQGVAAYGERVTPLLEAGGPETVRVGGTLRSTTSGERPVCSVIHQRWQQCGKNKCWTWYAGMLIQDGVLAADDGASWALTPTFRFLPREPGDTSWADEVEPSRATRLRARAKAGGVSGFDASEFVPAGDHRIVERCLEPETRVFAMGCRAENNAIGPCPGEERWSIVPGDGTPQPAIDEAANNVLYWFAGAFAAMFLACVLVYPRAQKLAATLEKRGGTRSRTHSWGWALLAIPVLVAITTLLQRGSLPQTSTWAYGRMGYAFASLVAAGLAIVLLQSARRRNVLRHAAEPILETPRSLLAQARDATVELAVRTAAAPATESVVAGDGVALSIVSVDEIYQVGKNQQRRNLYASTLPLEIVVTDESGDGRLDLSNALVDCEVRTLLEKELPAAVERRTGALARHESHRQYEVTEQVLATDAPLYVLGEVTHLEMHGGEAGYRAVRGAPTLGGSDAPLLVYAGSERGLIEELRVEHTALGIALVGAAGSLAMLLAAIAWLAAR